MKAENNRNDGENDVLMPAFQATVNQRSTHTGRGRRHSTEALTRMVKKDAQSNTRTLADYALDNEAKASVLIKQRASLERTLLEVKGWRRQKRGKLQQIQDT